jgi:DoxX-like family
MASSDTLKAPIVGKAFVVTIWIVQILAMFAFVSTGWIKLFTPIPQLAAMWPWTGELSPLIVRTLAVIDIAGGLGVLLPSLTRIKPGLTVIAAACCIALQICAMIFHTARGEIAATPVNVIFLALVGFVFWARRRVPVQPR